MEVNGQVHDPAALPQEKSPRYPLDRTLGGLLSRYESGGKEKNPFPAPAANRTLIVQPVD